MQQKLTKAYVQGCHDTWDILEDILKTTKGIGPQTEKRVMAAIKKRAEEESETLNVKRCSVSSRVK